MNSKIATNINILGKFCGIRDINELSQENLLECYGFRQADVMVLFGGSILAGGDALAEAIKNNIAKKICHCWRCRSCNRNIASDNPSGIS